MRDALRVLTVGLLVMCLLLPGLPGVAGASEVAPAQQPQQSLTEQPAQVLQQEDNSTVPDNSSTAPSAAERSRITPVRFTEEYLSVQVRERDAAFNTSGPFVVLSSTEQIEGVRISQQGAEADLLTGGHTVRVNYANDAAPDPEEAALYTLEIYYADGSDAQVELYATQTSVSVEAASLERYKQFIYQIRGDAEDNGYEDSPSGVESYYEDTKERADLLDSLFTEQAKQAVATAIAWFINPIAIGISLALIALASYWRISRRGYALDVIANDSGRAQRLRERLRLSYKEQQQTADEERLQELPQIGSMSEIYWRDGQGVSTVYQLSELARTGKTVQRDGQLIQEHHGVQDLDAQQMEDTWLESVAGTGRQRIASYDIALSHLKTALERMMSTYGMGHIYRETYEEVVQLIDERQEIVREGSTVSSGSAGAAPGGDD